MTKRKMFFRMITASLMRRRSRMLIALLAIAIGATILSGLVTIYYDIPRQMGAQFRNYGANMILTPGEGSLTQDDIDQATAVIASADLVGVAPYRYTNVRMHEQPIMAAGTDMAGAQKTSPYWLVDGNWPENSGELMIGSNVADSLRLGVGDTVTVVYTPQESDTADAEETVDLEMDFTVTGILSTGGSEENYVYMSMTDMEKLTETTDSIDLAELSVSGGSEQLSAYMDKINSSGGNAVAQLVKRVTASETKVLSKLQALILLVTIVVLALTMICVGTTMTAVVSERRKEIGLRKAIGASDSSILKEFMGEGMVLGAIGGLLGAFLGFGFAQIVSVEVFSSTITLHVVLVPISVAVSIVVTGISCMVPIRNAMSIDPALVLKGE